MASIEIGETICAKCQKRVQTAYGRCASCSAEPGPAGAVIQGVSDAAGEATRAVADLQGLCAPLKKDIEEARIDALLFFLSTPLFVPLYVFTAVSTKRWGYVEWTDVAIQSVIIGALALAATLKGTTMLELLVFPAFLLCFESLRRLSNRRKDMMHRGVFFGYSLKAVSFYTWGSALTMAGAFGVHYDIAHGKPISALAIVLTSGGVLLAVRGGKRILVESEYS